MLLSDQLDLQKTLARIPKWELDHAQYRGKLISVGMETREGWSGYLEFFVFWCPECSAFSKDYGHSWPERRYVTCQRCRRNFPHPVMSAVLREFLGTLSFLIRFRLSGGRNG